MYLDAKGEPVEGASLDGYLAVGVPGSVLGLETARQKFGTQSREALMAPAIRLAGEGFELSDADARILAAGVERLSKDPAAAAIFVSPDGKALAPGARLVQADLAAALSAIAQSGPDAFYKGRLADAIVAASATHGGILERADFEAYQVHEREPIRCDYRGYTIVSAPPPSSGGVIICEILNVLEAYPLGYLGWGSSDTVHLMVEAMRHAYVDRNSALGDPDFIDNPVEALLDKAYSGKIRERIDPYRAGVSAGLKPQGFGESSETTHYSIVDADGNAVAVTYTLNGSFGAGVVAPGTGILLNNEMDDFTAKPGVPNLYGLVQGEANAIEPKKTPLSSMSPTIVLKGDQALHGDRQPRRAAHHNHHAGSDRERDRPRHDDQGSDRRPAHPPPMAAGQAVRRALRALARHAEDPVGHGPSGDGGAELGPGGRHPGGRRQPGGDRQGRRRALQRRHRQPRRCRRGRRVLA